MILRLNLPIDVNRRYYSEKRQNLVKILRNLMKNTSYVKKRSHISAQKVGLEIRLSQSVLLKKRNHVVAVGQLEHGPKVQRNQD